MTNFRCRKKHITVK